MVSLAAFSHMVSLIYAAAASPAGWDEALDEVHRNFEQSGTGIVRSTCLAFADGVSRSMAGTMRAEANDAYVYYGRMDYVLQAVERGPVGTVRTSDELVAPYRSTEFHNDWVRPNQIEEGVFVRLTAEANPVSLVVAGSADGPPYVTDERMELIDRLVPHIQQALRTQRQLDAVRDRARHLAQTFDRLSQGVAIVTDGMRLIECNAAAEHVLATRDGLRIDNGVLVASFPREQRSLQTLAEQALTREGVRRGGSLMCQRISGKRPYVLHFLPLDATSLETRIDPVAAVFIIDPTHQRFPVERMLRELYGLTKAEGSVATLVLTGENIQGISDRLSLSSTTVRSHLQAIFAKTGTHRQAELVRVLSSIVP